MKPHTLALVAYIGSLLVVGGVSLAVPSIAAPLLVGWLVLVIVGIVAAGLGLVTRDRHDEPELVPKSAYEVTTPAEADLYVGMIEDEWLSSFRSFCADRFFTPGGRRQSLWLVMCAIDRRVAREAAVR